MLAELVEYQLDGDRNPASWEFLGWWGGDYNRLWFKSEGATDTTNVAGEGDVQLLYGRLVSPFWDVQLGARVESAWGDARSWASRGSRPADSTATPRSS